MLPKNNCGYKILLCFLYETATIFALRHTLFEAKKTKFLFIRINIRNKVLC